jgi:hypothetical protein
MGRRVGGRWVFDQALVRAHAAHRGRAA